MKKKVEKHGDDGAEHINPNPAWMTLYFAVLLMTSCERKGRRRKWVLEYLQVLNMGNWALWGRYNNLQRLIAHFGFMGPERSSTTSPWQLWTQPRLELLLCIIGTYFLFKVLLHPNVSLTTNSIKTTEIYHVLYLALLSASGELVL